MNPSLNLVARAVFVLLVYLLILLLSSWVPQLWSGSWPIALFITWLLVRAFLPQTRMRTRADLIRRILLILLIANGAMIFASRWAFTKGQRIYRVAITTKDISMQNHLLGSSQVCFSVARKLDFTSKIAWKYDLLTSGLLHAPAPNVMAARLFPLDGNIAILASKNLRISGEENWANLLEARAMEFGYDKQLLHEIREW